jgi:HK97 family phage portal protein
MDKVQKDLSRLRSEVRKVISKENVIKETNPFTGLVSGNYWTQAGMPWASGDARKAVLTEWFWQPIRGQPRRVDTNELRQFSQTFWINACINTILDEVSAIDWDLMAKEGYEHEQVEELIRDVKNFLKNPNKNGECFGELLRALIKDIYELDAGVIVKVYTLDSYDFDSLEPKSGSPMLKPFGERKLAELYVRDGSSFLMETDKFGYVKGYWQYSYQIPAHPMWFNKEEVSYVMRNKRAMSAYGFSPVQAILDIVKSLHYSTLYNKRFFEENALPDGIISLMDSNQNDVQGFINQWNSEFKGMPHKLAVTTQEAKWTPLGFTNPELQFLESQSWYFKLVIAMFGLTPTELGMTEDANRSSSASQAELTKRKGIRPLLKIIENFINNDIIPEVCATGGLVECPIEFNFIYDDPTEKMQRLQNAQLEIQMGIRTPNEVREDELGLPPLEGGDMTPSQQQSQMFQQAGIGQKPFNEEGNAQEKQEEEQGEKDRDNAEEEKNRKVKDKFDEGRTPIGSQKSFKAQANPVETRIQAIADKEKLNPKDLKTGMDKEAKEHPAVANTDMNVILQLVIDHLKENPAYYAEEKGANDGYDGIKPQSQVGAYYNEPQEVIQENRGQVMQPQNEKVEITGNVQDVQGQPDMSKCPACGFKTLHQSTSADDVGRENAYHCLTCGSSFNEQEVKDNQALAGMNAMMTQNNQTDPVGIPNYSMSKELKKNEKIDIMKVSEWTNLAKKEYDKHSGNYALSEEYMDLLREMLKDLTEEQVSKIIGIINNGVEKDEAISNIAKKIAKIVKDKERALTIARTEVSRVSNEGYRNQLVEDEVKKVKWKTSKDNRKCEKCEKLDGKIFSVDEFPNPADVHVNCRCRVIEWYG